MEAGQGVGRSSMRDEHSAARMIKPALQAGSETAHERNVIVLDDDTPFAQHLSARLERRGYGVFKTASRRNAYGLLHDVRPDYAVMELRLLHDGAADHDGIQLIREFRRVRPNVRILIATYYSSIASAVAAIKAGAVDYLSKPVNADDAVRALLEPYSEPEIRKQPISANRLRWEHILRVFHQCDQNVSETARRLNMHRRTLQRMLNKRPPSE